MDIDLRRELADILDSYGYDVVVLRCDRRVKCACWSPSYREPSTDCDTCLGTGYVYTARRCRTRSSPILVSPASVPASLAGMIYQQTSGPAARRFEMEVFYFPHDVSLGVNDYVLRVRWSGSAPVDVADVYLVIRYDRVRGRNGRVEYVYAMCTLRPEELKRFRRVLGRIKEALQAAHA